MVIPAVALGGMSIPTIMSILGALGIGMTNKDIRGGVGNIAGRAGSALGNAGSNLASVLGNISQPDAANMRHGSGYGQSIAGNQNRPAVGQVAPTYVPEVQQPSMAVPLGRMGNGAGSVGIPGVNQIPATAITGGPSGMNGNGFMGPTVSPPVGGSTGGGSGSANKTAPTGNKGGSGKTPKNGKNKKSGAGVSANAVDSALNEVVEEMMQNKGLGSVDDFTAAQRAVNGTEEIPEENMVQEMDPSEARYQQLLKMYGIGQPSASEVPAGMPDVQARQAGLGTGAPVGVYGDGGPIIKDQQAALDFYGGDQNKFDILSKLYGW